MGFVVCSLTAVAGHAWEIDNMTCRYQNLQDSQEQANAETNRRIQVALSGANDPNFVPPQPPERQPPVLASRGSERNEKQKKIKRLPAGIQSSGTQDIRPRKKLKKYNKQDEKDLSPEEQKALDRATYHHTVVAGGCDTQTALDAMQGALAAAWFGSLETWAMAAPISKCSVPFAQSVYQDFTLLESRAMAMAGLNPVLQINGIKVGADKLSHFMTEGYEYYMNQRAGKNLEQILHQGIVEEEGGYGLAATGVKSYADMAANYQGYLFWRQVLDGPDPYLKCDNGRWIQSREFRWQDFVSPSMDESVNCSNYRTEGMQKKVDTATENLARTYDPGNAHVKCPMDPEACREALNSIRDPAAAATVLHPRCRKAGEIPSVGPSLSLQGVY